MFVQINKRANNYLKGGILPWKGKKQMKETVNGESIKTLFSKNLRRLRNIAGMSQLSLAIEANLTHNFINDIENGKKWVSAETIEKLATALKVEPYQFFISELKWNEQDEEIFSIFLDDFSHSVERMIKEFHNRYKLIEPKGP